MKRLRIYLFAAIFSVVHISHTTAQNNMYTTDTIWLKTGEVIPCKINMTTMRSSLVDVQTIDSLGNLMNISYPKNEIIRIQRKSKVLYLSGDYRNMFPKRAKIYGSMGMGFPLSVNAGFNVITKLNIGAGVNYLAQYYKAMEIPPDYSSGALVGYKPKDKITVLSFCIIKAFDPKAIHPLRIILQGGPSRTVYTRACFSSINFPVLTSLSGNYNVSFTRESTLGCTLNVGFDIPLKKIFGIELAFKSNLNKYKNIYAVELNLIIGRVRDY